jgi:hypothetical protein
MGGRSFYLKLSFEILHQIRGPLLSKTARHNLRTVDSSETAVAFQDCAVNALDQAEAAT